MRPTGLAPRHAEPLLDVGLYLRAEAEQEAALRIRLQVPADVRDGHRIPRERHRDAGAQFDSCGVLGGEYQWQEGVVVDFGGPAAVVASSLQRARRVGDVGEPAGNGPVDLEAAVVTHEKGRYSKRFSMVNVKMPVRRSPFDDRKCA